MPEAGWPSVDEQLNQDSVPPGTALERLIREHQDFSLLRPEEATDRIGVPPWLRVYWRKQHPELDYRAEDPTGGYPRALKNIYAWMVTHPDLQPEHIEPTAGVGLPAVTASAVTEAAAAPTVGTNLRISGAQTTPRRESDIALNIGDTNKIIAGANAVDTSHQAQFFSSDGGGTWGQTTLSLEGGDTNHSDPAVGWTSDGTAWATAIGVQGATLRVRAYQSGDGGQTWSFDDTPSASQTAADKEMMCVDSSASSPFRDHIYVIWHNGSPAFVSRRTGPAGAWQTPVQVSGAETTGTAIGGAVTTNSAGDVFAMWPDTVSRGLRVTKSTDGGASFSSPVTIATTFAAFDIVIPSFALRHALIYLSAGANSTSGKNLLYAVWTDLTGASGCSSSANAPGSDVSSACKTRIWFARSTDGGTTWGAATMINDQPSLNDQFNPRLVVDEANGTLVVIYYDTVDDPGRLKTDVWYQSSTDDGVTWTAATKVTTSQTDETAGGATAAQYGDYNGLTGFAGKFFPSWTDRRNSALEEIWTAPVTVAAIPAVTGVSPASGSAAGGDTVTISGTGLTGATAVSFGAAAATVQPGGTDTQLTVTSPAANASGPVDVTVTTPAGTSAITPADQFTYG
jgi:IPT/TIG domain/BNR repeat-like domain